MIFSYTGAREPGGSGGVRPPLELEIYIVKISKIRKIYFFLSIGPPLGKNCSLAPVDMYPLLGCIFYCMWHIISLPTYQEKKNSPQERNESVKQIVDLIGTQERQEGTTTTTKKIPFKMCTCLSLPHSTNFQRFSLPVFIVHHQTK